MNVNSRGDGLQRATVCIHGYRGLMNQVISVRTQDVEAQDLITDNVQFDEMFVVSHVALAKWRSAHSKTDA